MEILDTLISLFEEQLAKIAKRRNKNEYEQMKKQIDDIKLIPSEQDVSDNSRLSD